jgi:actin cytoskeleton-regulatory complex protein PAN1
MTSFEIVKAKALYEYTGGGADELPFAEGDELTIIDQSEGDWWKTERGGVILIVPAAYLEVIGG